jgi:hypothetical protein
MCRTSALWWEELVLWDVYYTCRTSDLGCVKIYKVNERKCWGQNDSPYTVVMKIDFLNVKKKV